MQKPIITFLMILLFVGSASPQLTSVLTIENQVSVGNAFFFDVYLRSSQASDSIFLGNADFVLTFNSGNFNSPVLTNEGDAPGFCTFIPRLATPSNIAFTQDLYFNNTSVEVRNGNQLYINLQGPTPSITTISTRVARIDNQTSIHRLGRFKVSGLSIPSGFMNLQWVTASTIVTSFNPTTLNSSLIAISAINPPDAPLPVELTSFTGKVVDGTEVDLKWITKTEVNNYGFNVERRINESEWTNITFVEGYGNSNSPKEYSYSDKDLFAGGSKFQYRLKQVDTDGQFEYSDVVEVEVVPNQFELSQNYPNPFNPSTTIRFSLPKQTQLKINLYNMLGELVETIAEGTYEVGYHKATFNASNLPSGMYIYRIESNDFVQTKKMMLLK